MSEATLKVAFGKYEEGTTFKVVKENTHGTLVCEHMGTGKRLIIPVKYLETGKVKPKEPEVIVISIGEAESWVKVLREGLAEGSIDELALDRAVAAYHTKVGGSMDDLQRRVMKVQDAIERKLPIVEAKVGKHSLEPVGCEMSPTEHEVLKALLGGDRGKFSDPTLSVTSDSIKEVEEEKPRLGENQMFFIDITDGVLPESGINHIIDRYPEGHFGEDASLRIPKVKKTHEWDPEVLEALVLGHTLREKVLLTGLPGAGKSSSVEQFAAWVRQPYTRIGGRGDLETSSLVGYTWVDTEEVGGETVSKMVFKPGLLTQGVLAGDLVTIDEVMKIPAYIQMSMQHLYEKDGHLTVDDMPGTAKDKIVKPAPEFFMVLTDNVKGTGDDFDKFSATQIQDTSTLDRVNINQEVNYLKPEREVAMIMGMFPHADKSTVQKLVKFAGLVRNGYKQGEIALTLSPRGIIAILEMQTKVNLPIRRAIDLAFLNKIADDTEVIAIKDMLKTVNLGSTFK